MHNSCFMNAIFQAFIHTPHLYHGLGNFQHRPCSHNGFCFMCAFQDLFIEALSPSRSIVIPSKLFENLKRFRSTFVKGHHEDPHEFMQSALYHLRKYFPNFNNLIDQIFGVVFVNKLQCHCGCFADDKFGTEFELSLNITVPDRIENIQMALNNYFEKVRVKRYCSFCKKYNFSDKWLLLTEPPLVAIIHLKRFGNNEWKIAKPVSFSMELDLKPYSTGSDNVSWKYDLYAMVHHKGDVIAEGHFVCYVRSDTGQWYLMDDAVVIKADEAEVLSKEAYLLFYLRKDGSHDKPKKETNSKPKEKENYFGSRVSEFVCAHPIFTYTTPLYHGLPDLQHPRPCGHNGFFFLCAFQDLFINALHPSGSTVVSPLELFRKLQQFKRTFVTGDHEDPHEYMLSGLIQLQSYFPYFNNLIRQIFGAVIVSKVLSRSCRCSADDAEDISVEKLDLSLNINGPDNIDNIQKALVSYFEVKQEKVYCGICKEERTDEKQFVLNEAPLVSIVHLQRFDSHNRKIVTHVAFSMELDLQPYTNDADDVPWKYDLYAMVEHIGDSPDSGNWVFYIRSASGQWLLMNDTEVTQVDEEVVLRKEAWLLIYLRKEDTPSRENKPVEAHGSRGQMVRVPPIIKGLRRLFKKKNQGTKKEQQRKKA